MPPEEIGRAALLDGVFCELGNERADLVLAASLAESFSIVSCLQTLHHKRDVILSERGPKRSFKFGGGESKDLQFGRSFYAINFGYTTQGFSRFL